MDKLLAWRKELLAELENVNQLIGYKYFKHETYDNIIYRTVCGDVQVSSVHGARRWTRSSLELRDDGSLPVGNYWCDSEGNRI